MSNSSFIILFVGMLIGAGLGVLFSVWYFKKKVTDTVQGVISKLPSQGLRDIATSMVKTQYGI